MANAAVAMSDDYLTRSRCRKGLTGLSMSPLPTELFYGLSPVQAN